MFEREISCQHVDVNMRMPRYFSVEKPGIIPTWGQSVSDRDFHTCLFFTYDTLLPYSIGIGHWPAQVTIQSTPIACEAPVVAATSYRLTTLYSSLHYSVRVSTQRLFHVQHNKLKMHHRQCEECTEKRPTACFRSGRAHFGS